MELTNAQITKLLNASLAKSDYTEAQFDSIMDEYTQFTKTLNCEELEVLLFGKTKQLIALYKTKAATIVSGEIYADGASIFRTAMSSITAMVPEIFNSVAADGELPIEAVIKHTVDALLTGASEDESATDEQIKFIGNLIGREVGSYAAQYTITQSTPTTQTTEETNMATQANNATPATTETKTVEVTATPIVATPVVAPATPAAPKPIVENPIAQLMRETMQEEVDQGESLSYAWKMALLIARYRIVQDAKRALHSKCGTGMPGLQQRRAAATAKQAAEEASLKAHKESMELAGQHQIVV